MFQNQDLENPGKALERLAYAHGLDLAAALPAEPLPEHAFYRDWTTRGNAAGMRYLEDHRGALRADPRLLLPSARTVIAAAVLYNSPHPQPDPPISRYAWGLDYHQILRARLESLARALDPDHEWRVCVDTAPLLERALARRAGLGWIGKNTCLINQRQGSWFFLGEILTSLPFERFAAHPPTPPPDRCGACTRCIDACPTAAIVPTPIGSAGPGWEIDSRLCISYHTIESRDPAPPPGVAPRMGAHVFGCDICQDVCPWNRRAPVTLDPAFAPVLGESHPTLDQLAALSEEEFRRIFRPTPVSRAKYPGFVRNIQTALRNTMEADEAMAPDSDSARREPGG